MIFATLGKNPDRAKVIDFTDPYYMMAGMVLLAPKNTTIAKWEDLKGRKVCGSQGNMYNRTLQEKLGAETVLFTGTAQMYKAFQDNRGHRLRRPQSHAEAQRERLEGQGQDRARSLRIHSHRRRRAQERAEVPRGAEQSIKRAEAAGVLVNAEKTYDMGTSKFVTEQQASAK